jgi:uncharacterized phage protein gp47/JayE
VLLDEFHSRVSEKLGINTRQNPHSYFNVLFTAILDAIAELWELGEENYHAMYPFSAEDISLDHAVEYGGIMREGNQKTYYPIYCECEDGITAPKSTIVKSDTNSELRFFASANTLVSRAAFNRVTVRIVTVEPNKIYSVAVDGNLYSVTSDATSTPATIMQGIAALILPTTLQTVVDGGDLKITVLDIKKPSSLVLSENLTTSSVTGIVIFESEEYGEVSLPDGAINQIVTALPGLMSVENFGGYIAGRLRETDAELRKSYADKIFLRSIRMTESIRSAILQSVQGAENVAVFENRYDFPDADGRPPHSVEVICDGGDDLAIAKQILNTKAGGIQTFGNVQVQVPGEYGETITIRFNRPQYLYVWFKVIVTMGANLPADYVEIIKNSIVKQIYALEKASAIAPQKLIGDIYRALPNIEFLQIPVFFTVDGAASPDAYHDVVVPVGVRQRAVTDAARIEVVLNGA